jgi:hypothetical protein
MLRKQLTHACYNKATAPRRTEEERAIARSPTFRCAGLVRGPASERRRAPTQLILRAEERSFATLRMTMLWRFTQCAEPENVVILSAARDPCAPGEAISTPDPTIRVGTRIGGSAAKRDDAGMTKLDIGTPAPIGCAYRGTMRLRGTGWENSSRGLARRSRAMPLKTAGAVFCRNAREKINTSIPREVWREHGKPGPESDLSRFFLRCLTGIRLRDGRLAPCHEKRNFQIFPKSPPRPLPAAKRAAPARDSCRNAGAPRRPSWMSAAARSRLHWS